MAPTAGWDASRYHRVAQPHAAWGATVLDRLELRGDEVVLDAGCGSGRVTAQLLERLPAGRVLAVDNSETMLDQARQTLAAQAAQVTFLQADLLELDRALEAKVDAIFSTAVFHWIGDHDRLFAALHAVLQSGGALVAQCGGGDNLRGFMDATDAVVARPAYAALFEGRALWRNYATAEDTEARLRQAGFASAQAWLEPSPQTFATAAALADFARGVVLTSHVNVLPDARRDEFVTAVVDEIARRNDGGFVLDYVRLNLQATA
jgi:trans-aconitate 2-methyltransferase